MKSFAVLLILFLLLIHEAVPKKQLKRQRSRYKKILRIVGGRLVHKNDDYLSAVSIIYRPHLKKDLIKLACGATIIHKYWSLTASHCLKPIPNRLIMSKHIFLRGNTTYWDGSSKHYQDHFIADYSLHEDYLGPQNQFDNDIALLKVKEPFTGVYEKPVCIASRSYTYIENTSAVVFGWGFTDPHKQDSNSKALKAADIRITNFSTCLKIHESINKMVSARMVCAWGHKTDSCTGDSGGPMIQNDTLIGIVSWGMECASDHWPGIYTRISEFPEWILRKIKSLSKTT
ncbi:hypothetical protein ILUMI_19536 [Ignelater luminosus]|uniref:Peptidase S1 domain-containing protein n=1 Tax=Ignelater luminosus TaxID=2038154 RepID=A0A8K0G5H7_IGNLU|nr:hypothetical protein ILUMI_19536 [Ignelater luminosus]